MNSISKRIFNNLLYESNYVLYQDPMIAMDPVAVVGSIQAAEDVIEEGTLGEGEPMVIEGVLVPANLLLPQMLECQGIYIVCVDDEDLPDFIDLNCLLNDEGVIVKGRVDPVELKDIKTLATAQNINEIEALAAVIEDFIERISINVEDTYLLLGYEQKLTLCIAPDQIDDSAMEVPLAIGKTLKPKDNNKIVDAQYGSK